jgi:hypothetical protein
MNEKVLNVILDAISSEKMNWTRTWSSTLAKNFITQKPYK